MNLYQFVGVNLLGLVYTNALFSYSNLFGDLSCVGFNAFSFDRCLADCLHYDDAIVKFYDLTSSLQISCAIKLLESPVPMKQVTVFNYKIYTPVYIIILRWLNGTIILLRTT